jgi:hypothetical protein
VNSVIDFFKNKRYVYLSGVLSRENCDQLTNYMFDLYDKGQLEKDPQCPLSDSIYGSEIFDGILEKLAEPLSKQLGVGLLPTYTYARIYRPGEVLVKHKDRPSCEISGTMTLGFDPGSGIWPIFFGKDDDDIVGTALDINIGDMVMYHGNELNHWRPAYKGKWQVQVFFHYVDANGPHKEFAYDKRPKLGTQPKPTEAPATTVKPAPVNQNVFSSMVLENVVGIRTGDGIFPGMATYHSGFKQEHCFTPKQCQSILDLKDRLYPVKSTIGSGETEGTYDPSIRAVDTYHVEYTPETKWIFDKIATAVGVANAEYYRFDLYGITHALQLLHYKSEENGHYDWHIDCGDGNASYRKISLSIPLTDRSAYEGGELTVNNNGTDQVAIDEQGSITFFPSYLPHKVSPVTKGERWAIVIWINGPRFR